MGNCVGTDEKNGRNGHVNGNSITGFKDGNPTTELHSRKCDNGLPSDLRSPTSIHNVALKITNSNSGVSANHRGASTAIGESGVSRTPINGASSQQQTVIALYTYNAKDDGDLSFRKGDRLMVLDGADPDWWLAKHMGNNSKGYIPRNYVVSEALETEEWVSAPITSIISLIWVNSNMYYVCASRRWFFGKISRREAEKLLLIGDYPRGTFLIRNSEQTAGKLIVLRQLVFDAHAI